MTRYKTRPGVVLTSIAGQHVLVAAKPARQFCPYTSQINETAAFCWRILEQGADADELLTKLAEEYEIEDRTAAREDLNELLEQLRNANYLIEKP